MPEVTTEASMLLKLAVLSPTSLLSGGGKLQVPCPRPQIPEPEGGRSLELSDSEANAADDSESEKGLARSDVTPSDERPSEAGPSDDGPSEAVHADSKGTALSLQ